MPPEATPTADVTTTPAVTTETVPTTPATTTPEVTTTPATLDKLLEPAKTEVDPAAAVPAKAEEPAKVDEPAKAEPVKAEPPKYELKAAANSLLTKEQVTELETLAKSANLSEEQAQKVLATQEASVKAYNDKLVASHREDVTKWIDTIKTDKDLGGENLGRTLEQSKRTLETFSDAEFMKELDQSGFGNHPGLVRMLAKIGASMGTNSPIIKPSTTVHQTVRQADVLYGNKP